MNTKSFYLLLVFSFIFTCCRLNNKKNLFFVSNSKYKSKLVFDTLVHGFDKRFEIRDSLLESKIDALFCDADTSATLNNLPIKYTLFFFVKNDSLNINIYADNDHTDFDSLYCPFIYNYSMQVDGILLYSDKKILIKGYNNIKEKSILNTFDDSIYFVTYRVLTKSGIEVVYPWNHLYHNLHFVEGDYIFNYRKCLEMKIIFDGR